MLNLPGFWTNPTVEQQEAIESLPGASYVLWENRTNPNLAKKLCKCAYSSTYDELPAGQKLLAHPQIINYLQHVYLYKINSEIHATAP